MNIEVNELIKGIGNSDVLGIGKNENGDIYVTQGHFIIRVSKSLLIDNVRLNAIISKRFNTRDVEKLVESIVLGRMIMADGRAIFLSDLFYQIKDFKMDYDRAAIIEYNISENMALLENKVSRKQIVVNYSYLNMIKDCDDILVMNEPAPVVIISDNEVAGYILPMRVTNKRELFQYGK